MPQLLLGYLNELGALDALQIVEADADGGQRLRVGVGAPDDDGQRGEEQTADEAAVNPQRHCLSSLLGSHGFVYVSHNGERKEFFPDFSSDNLWWICSYLLYSV